MLNIKNKFNDLDNIEQLKRYGYWKMSSNNFFSNCYFYKKEEFLFGGLIASSRVISHKPSVIVYYRS